MLRAVASGFRRVARQSAGRPQAMLFSIAARGAVTTALPKASGAAPQHELLRAALRQHGAQLRRHSTQESLQQAGQKLRSAMEAPVKAAQAAGAVLSKAPTAAYARLPAAARKWVDATQQPGSLQRVLSLQLDAFWQRHGRTVYAAGAMMAAYVLWRSMYGVASMFVTLSDRMAAAGFMALAAAMVLLGVQYLRRQVAVDPAAVYRLAMLRLNMHPGILEVMGAPLAGSDVRASVLTGGGLKFRGLRPRLRARRVQMMFPLRGSDRRGLVSLEAKKCKGRYVFKLLAVDVPSVTGGQQRLFLEGGPAVYGRSGVLNELREPFLRALGMQETWDAEDEADALDEVQRAQQEQRAAERERALQAGVPEPPARRRGLAAGGLYERTLLAARQLLPWLGQQARQPGG